MNEHIELVKKWLDDPESVSEGERKANSVAADVFNELMDTSLGDRNNNFFYDCVSKCLMRSYKGKTPQIEVQY